MNLADIFLTASSNMFRSKLRTSLTILAIFIGAFTLTITSGIGSGISRYINQQLGNLGAKDVLLVQGTSGDGPRTGSADPKKYDPGRKTTAGFGPSFILMSDADVSKIKAHSGVVSVQPLRAIAGDYIKSGRADKYQITISPNIRGSNLDLAAGRNVDDEASVDQVVIPLSYISSLGFENAQASIGKTVTIGLSNALGDEKEQTATVVGVQQKGILGGGGIVSID